LMAWWRCHKAVQKDNWGRYVVKERCQCNIEGN
jgi:hypothetical protein